MSSMKTVDFTFDTITMWDWYDGIVRAIGSHQQRDYLIILAAWDISNARKAYVLVELDNNVASKMKKLEANSKNTTAKQETWNSFNRLFEEYLRSYKGVVYLTYAEPIASQKFSSIIVNSIHLQKLTNYDLEMTLTETACAFWFDLNNS